MIDARLHIKKPLSNLLFIGHDERVKIVEKYDR
jgi:hypothetical protein